MTVRIVEGVSAARDHLAQLRSREAEALPECVAAHLEAIFGREISAQDAVSQIITDVRRRGDAALRDYTRRVDGVVLERFFLDDEALRAAYGASPSHFKDALRLAADRIRAFHEQEPRNSWLVWDEEGGALGQMIHPIPRVGVRGRQRR